MAIDVGPATSADGLLLIEGRSGFLVEEIRSYLDALEHAYNSLYLFERLGILGTGEPGNIPFPAWSPGLHIAMSREFIKESVPYQARLVLASVQLESPGWWQVIGMLNPLEVIRMYLNDRHERRKDRDYREARESDQLRLQNMLLENQVVRERIDIFKNAGATEQDLALLINRLLQSPLSELNGLQDKGLILTAETRVLERTD